MTEINLKKLKKRRENVRKFAYSNKLVLNLEDGDMRSLMRNVRNLTSLTSISLNFSK